MLQDGRVRVWASILERLRRAKKQGWDPNADATGGLGSVID